MAPDKGGGGNKEFEYLKSWMITLEVKRLLLKLAKSPIKTIGQTSVKLW
jgi:hypothetical protein